MTTDITELAQREKFEAWFEGAEALPWGYLKNRRTSDSAYQDPDITDMWVAWKAAGAELVEALEKAQRANGYLREQSAEWERKAISNFQECAKMSERIYLLESRNVTVKLPKPHAHLIWIQAGHAPDDYWDDVAVSHSERDRCCDGSERYPVYARWEIEEMLAAAGIKVEAE